MANLLETVTGQFVDIENPDPATINIQDIAWGLSRMPRFCGHTVTVVPYNIAQHSIFVADEVELLLYELYGENEDKMTFRARDLITLKALLHDAEEIYTGDWPSPVKRLPALHPIIKKIEADLKKAIFAALVLPLPDEHEEAIIKQADRLMYLLNGCNSFQHRWIRYRLTNYS
jgi:5'-deoxynucleotidase YfbR-like HD superfamily hydrolase